MKTRKTFNSCKYSSWSTSWYRLSDPITEELIHDRISFRKFFDIKEEDSIPDETIISKFRNALIKNNLLESIFLEVKKSMCEKNLILNKGTLVAATLIHSSEPKRKRKTISNKANDGDASYTSIRCNNNNGKDSRLNAV